MTTRNYGWKPDLPDHRDHRCTIGNKPGKILPTGVDLRPKMPPVFDQGDLGSCTGNAIAGALGYLHGKHSTPFSRLFIYYNERVIEHDVASDNGAQVRNGIKVLVHQGVCKETAWPYIPHRFAVKPDGPAYDLAARNKITSYQRVVSLHGVKACLAAGTPIVFGFSVPESFESDGVAKTGVLSMPLKNERIIGGHAVLAVGYNDSARQLIVRNSWGKRWGQGGYFFMPYGYVISANLTDDFWVIRK